MEVINDSSLKIKFIFKLTPAKRPLPFTPSRPPSNTKTFEWLHPLSYGTSSDGAAASWPAGFTFPPPRCRRSAETCAGRALT